MIEWANSNSGFLLVILTAVYVITTLAILCVMAWSGYLTAQSIRQMEKIEQSRLRPYLSLSIKIELGGDGKAKSPYGYLRLHNSGLTQAKDITINMEPKIGAKSHVSGRGEEILVPFFVENPVPYIAPQDTLSDGLGFMSNLFKVFDPPIFSGAITYFDSDSNKYVEKFVIDIKSMEDANPYID